MNCLITSELSQVVKASEALHQFGRENKFNDELMGQLELILVEAINNIIEHAYQNKDGNPIQVGFSFIGGDVLMTLQDEGSAVPEEIVSIKESDSVMPNISDLPEGGWGLGLINMLADRIEFSVKDGMNILVLGKHVIS